MRPPPLEPALKVRFYLNAVTLRLRVKYKKVAAFTLIELSIVLVIIGLLAGGVLVGRDLIKAAEVRATITQLERYQTATRTFEVKYAYLPGDIPDPDASRFGFQARGTTVGTGNGNFILEGTNGSFNPGSTLYATGELVTFWTDLSAAHLIDQSFNTATNTTTACQTATILACFPTAKIGNSSYIYVYSSGTSNPSVFTGTNYFGLSTFSGLLPNGNFANAAPSITVQQAAAIDAKIDDGLPQSGNVTAQYVAVNFSATYYAMWASGGGVLGASTGTNGPTTAATPGSTTTCYDNSSAASGTPGVAGAVQHYSLEISNGANVNCALSFRFQ